MNLDLLALKALTGVARLSLEEARIVLDETQACADDIERAELRPVWAVIESRVRNRTPLDVVGIRHALREHGPGVIEAAVDCVVDPDLGQPRERLGMLRDAAMRRRLVEAMRAVAVAAKSGRPVDELDAMARALPALLTGARSRVRNCAADPVAMLDRLEAAWSGTAEPRLALGMGALDEDLNGLINNLYALGARAGVGKSAMVAGLVRNWTDAGVKVGVLCYEDDALDLQARLVAHSGGCSVKDARGDVLGNAYTRGQVADGLAWWNKRAHLLDVDDARPSGSSSDVLRSMRQMVDRGCRVVVLDNLTCVRLDGPSDRRHDLLVEQTLSDIRSEAQALKVPAIVVGHIKRGEGGVDESTRPPKLSDFSNSTAWDNYARVALGMWRGENGPMLRILKQTNGVGSGDFEVDFNFQAAVATGTRRAAPPQRAESISARRYGRGGE